MNYTLEEIYCLVGREDKVASLTFKNGSEACNIFGSFIVVLFIYTQKERVEMDEMIKTRPFRHSGPVKAKHLESELPQELIGKLETDGINSEDIDEIFYFIAQKENTYHSSKIRTINKIEIPWTSLPKGQDFGWMYGFMKRLVIDNVGLCPYERHFYLACKLYFENKTITWEEMQEILKEEKELFNEIEWEFLEIKRKQEEISKDEIKRFAQLKDIRTQIRIATLDKYLNEAGSSLKKLESNNSQQAAIFFEKVTQFHDRRLNITGKKPLYINIDSYLHIYMRHVKEMQINNHFESKDNFQWNEEDVFIVMEKVINEVNQEIQLFFEENPEKRYSRHGSQSVYFEGDYYTFHIESSGRVNTFHKNKKTTGLNNY